ISQAAADAFESEARLVVGRMPESKQITPAQQRQQLLALGAEANPPARKNINCCRSFESVESASQGELAGSGGSHVAGANPCQLPTAGYAAPIVECATSEGISEADVPVEIWQRRNSHWRSEEHTSELQS